MYPYVPWNPLESTPPEVNEIMLGKWVQRGLLAGTALLTAMTIGPGCADPESSLFIRQVVFTQPPDCAARAEPDGLSLLEGSLDVALRGEYRGTILVGNQLVPRGSQDLIRTESNRVALHTASVLVQDVSGNTLSDFEVPITGFVDQSTGAEPGFGLATLPLVDSGAINKIRASLTKGVTRRLISTVKVRGRTLGGSELESNSFQFVVQACNGCLVRFPSDADDPAQDGVDCLASSNGNSLGSVDLPCVFGQDQPLDCRLCRGTNAACDRP